MRSANPSTSGASASRHRAERIVRQLVRIDQQQRHLVVQMNQRVEHERVVGVEVVPHGQPCALAFEFPTVEIEPAGREPLAAACRP